MQTDIERIANAPPDIRDASRARTRGHSRVEALERALALRPADVETLAELARLLFALDRVEAALPWFEKAIASRPDLAELHAMLGGLLIGLGRIEEARRRFEAAIAIEPRSPRYYRGLLDTGPLDQDKLRAVEALAAAGPALAPEDHAIVHFTLGKTYDQTGRNEDAFRHYVEANQIMRGRVAYDERRELGRIEALRRVFTPAVMRIKAGLGNRSDRPVFIVGMPRSGTTLVEQILASHPDVRACGENPAFEKAAAALFNGKSYPSAVPALTGEELHRLGSDYLAALPGEGARRTIDKMLPNFLLLGLIHLALPKARIIHVVRDPVDTCLSCYGLRFTAAYPYMYDLGEMGRYYSAYRGLMAHWTQVLPKGVMLGIAYEDVVNDLPRQTRRMLAHCGLEWNPACLEFHKTERPVFSASTTQVRRPLFRHTRWRPPDDQLRPLLEALQ